MNHPDFPNNRHTTLLTLGRTLVAMCLLGFGPVAAAPSAEPVFRTVVRSPGQDGVFSSRIPALGITPKGTLIAAFDLRHANAVDLPGDIDVAVTRSFDGGTTWTPIKRVMDFDKNVPGTNGNGIGDPTVLVDRITGKIFISALWVRGQRSELPAISIENSGQFMVVESSDDGATWSKPINITHQVQDPAWGTAVALKGPGSGIQLKNGTLIIPTYHKTYPTRTTGHSAFIWSTDHGATWHRAKPAMSGSPRTSESQIAELEDGSLLMTIRNHGSKKLRAWSRYTGSGDLANGKWSEPWFVLPDPTCMASLIRHPKGPLLFSNPNSQTTRIAMTVRASTDGGRTWNDGRLITPAMSGYSCMAVLPDGQIGLLYETGKETYHESIHYARFPLEWIMSAGGKHTPENAVPAEASIIISDRTTVFQHTGSNPKDPANRTGFNHAPTVAVLPDGKVLAAWFSAPFEGAPQQHIMGAFSSDHGKTWSAGKTIQDTPERSDFDPSLVVSGQKTFLFFSVTNPVHIEYRVSEDAGRTWGSPVALGQPGHTTRSNGIRLATDELLVPLHRTGTRAGGVLKSSDHGQTWTRYGEVANPLGQGGEPSIAQLRSGPVMMVLRTRDGQLWRALSADKGETWAAPEKMGLTGTTSAAHLLCTRDGVLVLTHNPSPEVRRYPLTIRLSRDDGKTWSEPTILADRPSQTPGWSITYPTLTELRDGTLLAVWTEIKSSADEKYGDIRSARISLRP